MDTWGFGLRYFGRSDLSVSILGIMAMAVWSFGRYMHVIQGTPPWNFGRPSALGSARGRRTEGGACQVNVEDSPNMRAGSAMKPRHRQAISKGMKRAWRRARRTRGARRFNSRRRANHK
jgi:hypothetical protein